MFFFNFIFCVRFVVCGLASPAIFVLILFLAAIAKAPSAIPMLLPLIFVFVRVCGLKQQPICASLCDDDPIIFACLKQVLHFLQPRLATLTSLAEFCIFQPAPSRLQHFSARPPAWFSGRLKSPDFRQAGSLAARQAQPSFSLLRLCSPPGVAGNGSQLWRSHEASM